MRDFLIDMIVTVVKNMIGKYSKECLNRLEAQQLNNPAIRKVILDTFGDMSRDIDRRVKLLRE